MSTFFDPIIKKAEELELDKKADHLAKQADQLLNQAVHKAGQVTHDNRDKVQDWLDKAGTFVDEKTEGKYADKVAKARAAAVKGVSKLAEQRGDGHQTGSPTAPAADGTDAVPPATDAWSASSDPTPAPKPGPTTRPEKDDFSI